MNLRASVVVVCVVGALQASIAGVSQARQERAKPEKPAQSPAQPTPEEMQKMQEQAMAEMAPVKEHERLAGLAGSWKMKVSFNPEPGAPKITSEGKAEAKMVLGGRFLKLESSGEMMGIPVESLTMFGFDRRFGKYTLVGYDTMGTYYVEAAGAFDEATSSMTLSGTNYETTLKQDLPFRFVVKLVGSDEWHQTLVFDMPGMGEMTVVEIVYTRVK